MNSSASKPRLVLLLLTVLLSGCRLGIAVDLAVDPDGAGTLSVSVSADGELEDQAAQAGVDPLGRLVERVDQTDGPWAVDEQLDEADGTRTVTVSRDFGPGQFATAYAELQQALEAPEARLLGPLSVDVDPETELITVEGVLPLEVTEVAATDLATDVGALTGQLEGVVASTLTVTTPGPLVDGTVAGAVVEVEDRPASAPYPDAPATLTWRAAPGTVTQVAATFEPGGSPWGTILLVGAGGAVALLLVGGGVWAQRRR